MTAVIVLSILLFIVLVVLLVQNARLAEIVRSAREGTPA